MYLKQVFRKKIRRFLPQSIKPRRIWRGPIQGKYIVTSWRDYPAAIMGRTERPLLEWFTQNVKFGETWLDVGAHYGYTAIALCKLVGDQGRVFAFEPMISTAGYLSQTRFLNHFHQLSVMPLALGSAKGLVPYELPSRKGMVESIPSGEGWMENILVTGLDWVWPNICGNNEQIDGIKIDVQGMEIETLKGMIASLKKHRPKLVIELHKGVDRAEFLSLIDKAEYSPEAFPIEPIQGEIEPKFVDDHSYVFFPSSEPKIGY